MVALSIPFSVGFTFPAMKFFDISANLMSLGGIAIAIGMMVDGAVVVVENIDRMLRESSPDESRLHLVARACQSVARPILFAISIIIIVFLPLFTLQGWKGDLPATGLYRSRGHAWLAVLCPDCGTGGLLPVDEAADADPDKPRKDIVSLLLKGYQPLVQAIVARRWIAVTWRQWFCSLALPSRRGWPEFVPRFNEGDLLIRATMAPSISLEKAETTIGVFERQLMAAFRRSPQSGVAHWSG